MPFTTTISDDKMRLLLNTSLIALSGLLCSPGHAAEPGPALLTPLLEVISERLTVADQVALSKWDSGQAVEDVAREQQVIAGAEQRAAEYDLDPSDVQQLFRAQIEANKRVQNALLAQWRTAGRAPQTPRQDLAKDIRPQLDQLQLRLLRTYADFQPLRDAGECSEILSAGLKQQLSDPIHDQALVLATAGLCKTGQ